MAIRPIVLYPDPGLLAPTRPVEAVDDEIRELVRDMVDTMYNAPGVGLAANQVGVPLSLFIVDLTVGEEEGALRVFINPVIRESSGSQLGEEGCLSFPDVSLEVDRPQRVTVEATDSDGNPFTLEAEGLLARAIVHENEHLAGVTFLGSVSTLRRELVKKSIRKRIKSGDWVEATAQ